jgi:hypothetical protein
LDDFNVGGERIQSVGWEFEVVDMNSSGSGRIETYSDVLYTLTRSYWLFDWESRFIEGVKYGVWWCID